MKPLSDLLQGEFGYIVDLKDKNVIAQLFEAGCFPGDLIRVIDNHPTQEFITFRYRKNLIHLHRAKAKTIMTNPVSYYFCLN
jgi:Fe2+ transport system protein FeoA